MWWAWILFNLSQLGLLWMFCSLFLLTSYQQKVLFALRSGDLGSLERFERRWGWFLRRSPFVRHTYLFAWETVRVLLNPWKGGRHGDHR